MEYWLDASCPARGTWIEIGGDTSSPPELSKSCPARGTWIEMALWCVGANRCIVVPRKGHVD